MKRYLPQCPSGPTTPLSQQALTDPDHIVLGGHLANWLPWLRPGIDAHLGPRRTAFLPLPVTVIPDTLGPDAALHGALTAGREQILADPTAVPRDT